MSSPVSSPWLMSVVSNDGTRVAVLRSALAASPGGVAGAAWSTDQFRLAWGDVEVSPRSVQSAGLWLVFDVGKERIPAGTQVQLRWLSTESPPLWKEHAVHNGSTLGTSAEQALAGADRTDFLQGTADSDYLTGGEGDDLMDGGPGNDVLVGGGGSNHFIWGRGSGLDTLAADYGATTLSVGTLWVRAGVTPDQLRGRIAANNPSDIELVIDGTTDVVRIANFLAGPSASGVWLFSTHNRVNPLNEVVFSDGTRWTREDLLTLALNGGDRSDYLQGTTENDVLRGGSGDDTLVGLSGDDTLLGGPGQDRLEGGVGNTVYQFRKGDGADTITSRYQGGVRGVGTLEFGADIRPSQLEGKVSVANPSDAELWIGGSQDRIIIGSLLGGQGPDGMWRSSSENINNPIQLVKFADGTVWTAAAVETWIRTGLIPGMQPAALPIGPSADALSSLPQSGSITGSTNRAPAASDGSLQVTGPGPHAATLPWATDPEGDLFQYQLVSAPMHGSLALTQEGLFRYNAPEGFVGNDTFRFRVVDAQGAANSYQMRITVAGAAAASIELATPVGGEPQERATTGNRPPEGSDGATDVLEDGFWRGKLPAAVDPDGDAIRFALVKPASAGSVTVEADGAVTYQPHPDYAGIDSFGYTVTDSRGGVNTYTHTVFVNPVNDAPKLSSLLDGATAIAGSQMTIHLPTDLFIDPDSVHLTWSAGMLLGGALPEWLQFDAGTRTLTGMPQQEQVGTTSLYIRASDGQLTATALLSISIVPAPTPTPTPATTSAASSTASGNDRPETSQSGVVTGSDGDDMLLGSVGDDRFDGGPGIDRFQLNYPRDAYRWHQASQGNLWIDGPEGTDQLLNVERLIFGETTLALDLSDVQSAGQAALLLGAVLGKPLMLTKSELTGVVVDLFDSGYSIQVLAGAIMRLPIWGGVLTPTNASTDIARYLLTTVLGGAPSDLAVAQAASQLEQGPEGAYLASLALSVANQGQVDLVGLQQTGLWLGPHTPS